MWLIRAALRRPVMMVVIAISLALTSILAISRSRIDIFPDMNAPVIYVAQPFGGMSPQQMEGYLSYYYEYHFLYIGGIESVEAKSIQGAALLRLTFHPGTNMSQAMAETISYVNRARAFMPPGTVSPFVVRYDAGTLPIGYLVFSSTTKTLGEIQDAALNRVRPVFGTLPGVSSPPPFGGNQRTIVINVDPAKLRGYGLAPNDVLQSLVSGNSIQPAGTANIGAKQTLITTDSSVTKIDNLLDIPVRQAADSAVYLRDVASVADTADNPAGYALINGKRTVYIPVTKRADASTIAVVGEVRQNLPRFQSLLPDDVSVSYQLDQSGYVTDALWSVVREGALGALLVGLTLLYFLRDWRSALFVVVIIPFCLLSAVVALWLSGQTINIMTLGGLALAIGILVDEGVVLLENIHVHLARGKTPARAVLDAGSEVAVPQLLAMACIVAVFLPSFFMTGPAGALFAPLALAVGFSMVAAYLLFTLLLPILSVWFAKPQDDKPHVANDPLDKVRHYLDGLQGRLAMRAPLVLGGYLVIAAILAAGSFSLLRAEIFPSSAARDLRIRLDAPQGTRIAVTEERTREVLDEIQRIAGRGAVEITLSYVGVQGSSYPINTVFLWTGGPHEAVINLSLSPNASIDVRELTAKLRDDLPAKFPDTQFSFEPGDLVSQILNFGTSSTADIAVLGPQFADVRGYATKLKEALAHAKGLADVKFGQSLDYPNLDVRIDRVAAGQLGTTAEKVGQAVVASTASTRFVTPNYWRDPKSGISYQVQVQVPQPQMTSESALASIPVPTNSGDLVLGQLSSIRQQTVPGELDRKNGQWLVSVTANLSVQDLTLAQQSIASAIASVGPAPKGVTVDVRGQPAVMREMLSNLEGGLALSVLVMLLLLTANFQSVRLALIALSTIPAVLAGALLFLLITNTSINLESLMGMIMGIGVALANAILVVTFAERGRREGLSSFEAGRRAASERLRPVMMTSFAMIAGMVPMALAIGGGAETAPLGRAVIGGLLAATAATLVILPLVFGIVQRKASLRSASLDPDDPINASLAGMEMTR
ncbi:efflux RND transporter permease subunit [Sphingomonas sp. GlSt437]|uniref:efflux RND transporter permease subunit n=2 Tax=Pseudomonadota TaxID=1224 RepID=UPI003A8B82DF